MIDVFVSRPTWVDEGFRPGLEGLLLRLEDIGLRRRSLGSSDYPTKAPLDEVITLLAECRGAVILGYPEIIVTKGSVKGQELTDVVTLATEWNHIEAGLAYARELPLLVIHHVGVTRGIFDRGALGAFIYERDLGDPAWSLAKDITGALRKWRDEVLARNDEERRQLAEHDEQERQRNEADILAALVEQDTWHGRGHRIVITNRGPGDARALTVEFANDNCPIPQAELKDKLPVPVLHPDTNVKLLAALSKDNHPPFDVVVKWTDTEGNKREKQFRLT